MRPQTVTADIFERLVQLHPNPIITADVRFQYLTVGEREYKTELAVANRDPWCPECGMAEMHDGPGGPIVIRHNPGCRFGDAA